ncbi:carbohydrate ABC transporter permease [Halostella sp. JP-L12]|uniref:carbohydrate ABC transporter permease n=1 Tax=Halostella TaxID=1843185 RepID=UPI000EF79D5A|nr:MULTISPECIES: carbohydrate ABC transporter permease [Halostella]NHN49354.1 carbohydrate ABC transporter permease [Halostella sp. JP-L12]
MSVVDDIIGTGEAVDWDRRKKLKRYSLYGLLVAMSIVYFFPIYWMAKSALQPRSELYSGEVFYLPNEVTLENFNALLFDSQFLRFYLNSIIVAIGVMAVTIITSTLAGYALTRLELPFKKQIAQTTIFSYMYPPILLVMPMFLLWFSLRLTNTYVGLILAQSALTVPFSVWLMWQFFQTIPISLEESAWMYGAGRMQSFFGIALPMAKPGLVAVAIFSFAVSWNDFTMANILMQDPSLRTLPVGVLFFTESNAVDWGAILSASALIAVPPLLLVYFLQRYLLRGFQLAN